VQSCVPIELGQDCSIDAGVILGYPPGRPIERKPVRIGDHAQIRSGTVIYASVEIGNGFETGHNVVIREDNRIGHDCAIWNGTTIDYTCVLGNRVRIHCNSYVCQYSIIEDDVFLAPGVMLANDPHPLCTKCMQGPTIKSGAKIGINSTIRPPVIVGENALVGAGSVVISDVPARAVVVGSPARIIGDVDSLKCAFDLVKPYENGIDVRRRPEWNTIAPLSRPVVRPDRQ
jgi:acetyltransferase-like isoleucine patch superfamily enzyme